MIGPVSAERPGPLRAARANGELGRRHGRARGAAAAGDAADPGAGARGPRHRGRPARAPRRATASSSPRCGRTHQGCRASLNWRVTMRRGEPYVNLRHPERSTDLIVLVDTFSACRAAPPGPARRPGWRRLSGAPRPGRARRLRRRPALGRARRWGEPSSSGSSPRSRRREWHHSYAWKSAETIPSRTLPATGLVVAISPLEDPRMLEALATIRARGVDLAVIETVGPPPVAAFAGGRPRRPDHRARTRRDARQLRAPRRSRRRLAGRRVPRGASRGARRLAAPGEGPGHEMRHPERRSRSVGVVLSIAAASALVAWAVAQSSATLAPVATFAGIAGVVTLAAALAGGRSRTISTGLVLRRRRRRRRHAARGCRNTCGCSRPLGRHHVLRRRSSRPVARSSAVGWSAAEAPGTGTPPG